MQTFQDQRMQLQLQNCLKNFKVAKQTTLKFQFSYVCLQIQLLITWSHISSVGLI